MSNITHFGKTPLNHDKKAYVKKIKKNSKNILNNSSTSSNRKKEKLDEIFQSPDFRRFVDDLKLRVAKLNREYIIQQSNNNPHVSREVSALANTLNAYTNELIGFYENTYYNIPNNSDQKQFIRDLKMIIGTYGKLQEDLTNIIYTSNTVENIIKSKGPLIISSHKSDTMKKIEKEFLDELRRKAISQPVLSSPSTPISSQAKPQSSQAQPGQPQPNQTRPLLTILEANLENNCNNCYRNSVIHLLLTLLRDTDFQGDNLENAFDIQRDDVCFTKNNLKILLENLINGRDFHPQSILQTYNPILLSPQYVRNNHFSLEVQRQDIQFRIKKKSDNSNINNFSLLCTYYPLINDVRSKDHFFELFKNNLKRNITILDMNNRNVPNQEYYINLIINSIYKSYSNSLIYLISEQGLFRANIFSDAFLNNIKINDNTYILKSFKSTNTRNGRIEEKYDNLEDLITNALQRTQFNNPNNKYIILSTNDFDLAQFDNKNFNNQFIINNNHYEVTDIIYSSNGHYVTLNMRNNEWYKYDDTESSHPVRITQNRNIGMVDFNIDGFYPNIFLLKKII